MFVSPFSYTEDVIPRLLTFTTNMHNHSVSYLPQLQPGVIADELDVGDPVDATTKPPAPPLMPVEQPAPHGTHAANNILAPTLRQLRRLRRLRRHVQVRLPGADPGTLVHAAVEPVDDASLGAPVAVGDTAEHVVPDPPCSPWQHNVTVRTGVYRSDAGRHASHRQSHGPLGEACHAQRSWSRRRCARPGPMCQSVRVTAAL